MIKVLHKSGDASLPNNYRPIATIPILYKLYARLLYNRLEPTLDKEQSDDQAGFRRHRGATNHLYTITQLQEAADEWQVPLWIAAVDFRKAFDSVSHSAIWTSLAEQGVPHAYVALLSKLYDNQTATVRTDRTSRLFNIERGMKQGDPLSSLLFNAVSEHIMRRIKVKWATANKGLPLHPHMSAANTLTNLRFADDILLVATSLTDISSMLADLSTEAQTAGLRLHPDKTKILHNGAQPTDTRRRRTPNNVQVLDMTIEILPTYASTKYLGRKLSFSNPHRTEIENRISQAWKKFYTLKQELTGPRYNLTDRLRLFHGTVTPTILYGCEAWTTTTELENRLKRVQRQMLRMILHAPRRATGNRRTTTNTDNSNSNDHNHNDDHNNPTINHNTTDETDDASSECNDVDSTASQHPTNDQTQLDDNDDDLDELEPWSDWVKRCTHDVERRMRTLKLDDWKVMLRRRRWRWARKISEMPLDDWTAMATRWDPTLDIHINTRRRQGRPKTRWSDDIVEYVLQMPHDGDEDGEDSDTATQQQDDRRRWMQLAKDEAIWSRLEEGYCHR